MMKLFKIRASASGQIMTSAKGNITEKQLDELTTLSLKEKPTAKQTNRINELIYKRNNPELSETTKTFCKIWLKQELYNRVKDFSNKYTEKGLICEDNSFDFIADHLNLGILVKNEEKKENEYMTGECDINIPNLIIDAKNSWDCFTFPLFETEIPNNNYYWQAQTYMKLYDKSNFKLVYVLSDTPLHLIEKEAYWYAKNNGYDENDPDIYMDFVKRMTYSDVSDNLKIKIFDIKRNDKDIECLEKRVIECRKYINELLKILI